MDISTRKHEFNNLIDKSYNKKMKCGNFKIKLQNASGFFGRARVTLSTESIFIGLNAKLLDALSILCSVLFVNHHGRFSLVPILLGVICFQIPISLINLLGVINVTAIKNLPCWFTNKSITMAILLT